MMWDGLLEVFRFEVTLETQYQQLIEARNNNTEITLGSHARNTIEATPRKQKMATYLYIYIHMHYVYIHIYIHV